MKRIYSLLIFLLFSFFTVPTFAAAETFIIDPDHSHVLRHVKHFDFSSQVGKWYASGKLVLDKDKPENSQVNAEIKVANLITGHAELDKHLKSKDFFDVTKYPIATFVSDKVDVTGENTANVNGKLTLHGVTKPVTLAVTLNKSGISPITKKMTVGFTATTMIKRSDFGISAYVPNLGDDVRIEIEAEANQTKK